MNLSDDFRYVIDNMPCCNSSIELDEYIREFIVEYFGTSFVKEILLGGIAQQRVTISEKNRKSLEENGLQVSSSSSMSASVLSLFSISTGSRNTEERDQTRLNTLRNFSEASSVITIGGSTNLRTLGEWSETVPNNPTIIKFTMSPILSLFTAQRFPSDPLIFSKLALVKNVLDEYMNGTAVCPNNCSGSGTCMSTGYFQYGQCRCNRDWGGIDCSIYEGPPPSMFYYFLREIVFHCQQCSWRSFYITSLLLFAETF